MKTANLKWAMSNYKCPIYMFDIDKLYQRLDYLKSKLSGRLEICFAVKANPFLIEFMHEMVARLEVCSPGELEICNQFAVAKEKIVVSGVYKDERTILKRSSSQSVFTIESLSQLNLLEKKAMMENTRLRVLIRLSSANQFGVDREELLNIIAKYKDSNRIHIIGLQYYSKTQKKSLKVLENELEMLDELYLKIENEYDLHLEELEYGPGFPVMYFGEDDFNEDVFLEEFKSLTDKLSFKGKIILELGRSLASSCGSYMTKVVDLKTTANESYAIVDGGMHHITYYGQFMATRVPSISIYPKRAGTSGTYTICGSLCTINDMLVKRMTTTMIEIGDYLVFNNTGAYSMCEGITLFLSRNLPMVVAFKAGKSITLRDEIETYKLNSRNI